MDDLPCYPRTVIAGWVAMEIVISGVVSAEVRGASVPLGRFAPPRKAILLSGEEECLFTYEHRRDSVRW